MDTQSRATAIKIIEQKIAMCMRTMPYYNITSYYNIRA